MKGYYRKIPAKNSKGYTWSYTVDLGRDPATGKRKQKTKRGFSTKGEAQSAAAKLITEIEQGNYIEPSITSFGDFLHDYIQNHLKPKVGPNTSLRAEVAFRNHIGPDLGHHKLKDLKSIHLDKFYSSKLKDGFSPGYIHQMHELINSSLEKALIWEMVNKNVAKYADPPKKKKTKFDVWTMNEIETFLEGIKHITYYPFYLLAAYTGLRKGEIIALRWKDLDLENAKVSVNRTFIFKDYKPMFVVPKTESSIRTIGIPPSVVKELKKYKMKEYEARLILGYPIKPDDLVFTTRTGKNVMPSQIQKDFKKWIDRLGMKPIRFHDLRHSHATALILELGVNIKAVSERLGHSGIKVTLDVYSHVLPQTETSLVSTLESAISTSDKSGRNVVNGQKISNK